MSYGVTPPDQVVEIRPDPVVESSSGRLPNQGEKGRSRPTCLLRLQSLSLPLEAPNPAAPSLGALGAGERRGGRASDGAPPGGIRITACLLDGCFGNGLSLLAPWSAIEAPLADPHHSHPFPATLLCPCRFCVSSPLCHLIPSSTMPAVSLHPQHLSVHRLTPQSLGCARSWFPMISACIQAGTSEKFLSSVLGSAALSFGLSRKGYPEEYFFFSTQMVKKALQPPPLIH